VAACFDQHGPALDRVCHQWRRPGRVAAARTVATAGYALAHPYFPIPARTGYLERSFFFLSIRLDATHRYGCADFRFAGDRCICPSPRFNLPYPFFICPLHGDAGGRDRYHLPGYFLFLSLSEGPAQREASDDYQTEEEFHFHPGIQRPAAFATQAYYRRGQDAGWA
jgi:hypothetical protein